MKDCMHFASFFFLSAQHCATINIVSALSQLTKKFASVILVVNMASNDLR